MKLSPVMTGSPQKVIGRAGQQHAHAVDLQLVQALDGVLDDPLVAPAHQPEGRGAVEEVVLAGAFPDEMPGVSGIHADGAAPVAVGRLETRLVRSFRNRPAGRPPSRCSRPAPTA